MNEIQSLTYDEILSRYNEAYYNWINCPDSEEESAKSKLDFWRHVWFNYE